VTLAAFVYAELLKELVIKKKVKEQAEILIHRVKMIKWWSNYSLYSPKKASATTCGTCSSFIKTEAED